MKLDDLTGILSDAVEKAVSTAEQQILERIRFYFEDPDPNDDDETLVPRSIIVKIGDVKIKYPYLAMGTLKPIEIGVFKFKLSTDLDLSGHEDAEGKPNIQVNLKQGLFKNSSHLEIEAEFKGGETSEAFSQMQDKFNDMIAKALAKLNSDMEI